MLTFPDALGLRPTPARIRETLFNWLQMDIAGKRCLDLYAGSGALGFEAASRGAKEVIQVEHSASVVKALANNQALLATKIITIVQQDTVAFLNGKAEAFDLVFVDPPFADKLIGETCLLLEQRGWLSAMAKIYIESNWHSPLTGLPINWQSLKQKKAGNVSYQLFNRIS